MCTEAGRISAQGGAAAVRLVLLACLSVLVLVVDNAAGLVFLYIVALAWFLASRPTPGRLGLYILFSLAAVWGFVLTQSLFYPYRPRTLLLLLISPDLPILGPLTGGVGLYLEGIEYGAIQSLRFVAVLTAALAVVWTTSAQQLLAGLRALRLQFRLSFMVATAVRFIPAITSEVRSVLAAMRVRGYPLRPTRPLKFLGALISALGPILHRNMRRAALLADSIECRGFAAARAPAGRQFHPLQRAAVTLAPAITLLILCAKLITRAAQSGVFYDESLIWIYNNVQAFL